MDIELQKAVVHGAATVISAVIVAGVGTWIAQRFARQRDREVREKEWIDQATALTRLDIERKMNTWSEEEKRDIRPPILDFLAYYRDLKKLDRYSPGELYEQILAVHYAPRDDGSDDDIAPNQAPAKNQ